VTPGPTSKRRLADLYASPVRIRVMTAKLGIAVIAVLGIGLAAIGEPALARFADNRDAARASVGDTSDAPIVDCDSRIQVIPSRRHPGRIPRSLRKSSVFAGPVVFIGAKQEEETVDPGAKRFRPVKAPMLVEAGHTVTVTVSPPTGRRAVVEVGRDRRPHAVRGPSVELRACARRAKVAGRRVGRRTFFVGGFRLDGPMCLVLTVAVEGTSEPITRRVAFGKGECGAA
jgi:hypothetical protein